MPPEIAKNPGFWGAAYRPFFALAGGSAFLVGLGWMAALIAPGPGSAAFAGLHAPLLLNGFIGAAATGYLLTALPSWTGRAPIGAFSIALLAISWGMAQAAILPFSAVVRLVLAATFPLLLGAILLAALLRAGRFRKIWVLCCPLVLALQSAAPIAGPDWRLPEPQTFVILLMLLIRVIGIPMIEAFCQNHLACNTQSPPAARNQTLGLAGQLSLPLTATALAMALTTKPELAGIALILAGAVQLWQVLNWLKKPIWNNGLLLMLVFAYAWLPFGLGLLGVLQIGLSLGGINQTDALHALTMGGAACMIAAVAGRAAAHRSKTGALRARPVQIAAFVLIWAAPLLRVMSGLIAAPPSLLLAAAMIWTLGWGLWLWALRPALSGPVPRPTLSGARNRRP